MKRKKKQQRKPKANSLVNRLVTTIRMIIENKQRREKDDFTLNLDDVLTQLQNHKTYSRLSQSILTKYVENTAGEYYEKGMLNEKNFAQFDYYNDVQEPEPPKPNFANKMLPCRAKKLQEGESDSMLLTTRNRKKANNAKEDVKNELSKIIKKRKDERQFQKPEKKLVTFEQFGGIDNIIQDIKEYIQYPIKHKEIFVNMGITAPKGILLCGPPGVGKTTLGDAICYEMELPFKKLTGTEIISSMSGESENNIREMFQQAQECAPSIIFIDEIDSIASKRRNASKEMEKRIVIQLIACLDKIKDNDVYVIATTCNPDQLDNGLRRTGRFDREITIGVPDRKARLQIIQQMSKKLNLSYEVSLKEVARITPGYVGADLQALMKEAGMNAIRRIINAKEDLNMDNSEDDGNEQSCEYCIVFSDIQHALKKVQPSAQREGFAVIPDTTWDDIGALENLRAELEHSILLPISEPERFQQFGVKAPAGVLLYGPPGCGKTLLAKAVANQSMANFIAVKGPELLNKYVGESEKAVRELFRRASTSSPCIIFFDELDALCPKRGMYGGNQVTERVVNQLLTEMDGMDSRKDVYIIAATNRPDIIDPAILRPGRLDKLLFVPLPSKQDRLSILQALTRKTPLNPSLRLSDIAFNQKTNGFSGADLQSLVKEACINAIQDKNKVDMVKIQHFEEAMDNILPSVSEKDNLKYEKLRKNLRRSKSILSKQENDKNQ